MAPTVLSLSPPGTDILPAEAVYRQLPRVWRWWYGYMRWAGRLNPTAPPGGRTLFQLLGRLAPDRIVGVETPLGTMHARLVDLASWTLLTSLHSPHPRDILRMLLRPGDTFLDVGANCGMFTWHAAHFVGEQGTLLAVEPNPMLHPLVQMNMQSVHSGAGELFRCGAGDKPCSLQFEIHPFNSGGGTLSEDAKSHRAGTVEVPVRTIDQLLAGVEISGNLVMKLDCEGFEGPAIRGGAETLRRYRPPIILEINHFAMDAHGEAFAELGRCLQEVGYESFVLNEKWPLTDLPDLRPLCQTWASLPSYGCFDVIALASP